MFIWVGDLLMNDDVNKYEVITIFEKTVIRFKDGEIKFVDSMQVVSGRGIITGNIVNEDKQTIVNVLKRLGRGKNKNEIDKHRIFIESGFIPIINISDIEKGPKKSVLKKKH